MPTPASEVIARPDGFLTRADTDRPERIGLEYLEQRQGFGLDGNDLAHLDLTRTYRWGRGTTFLQWAQRYRGISVFGSGLRANVDAAGRLINVSGAVKPDLAPPSLEPRLSARDAVLAAGRDAGSTVAPGLARSTQGPDRRTKFTPGHEARLVLFPDTAGTRLAWRVLVRAGGGTVLDAVVDARNGRVLLRGNLVRHATALAFRNYPGALLGGSQAAVSFPTSGSDPWLTEATRLIGNNAHVYSDPEDQIDDGPPYPAPPASDEIPPTAGNWNYPQLTEPASAGQSCPPSPGCSWSNNPSAGFGWADNRRQAGTQLFYLINHFHDHLTSAPGIGFSEASGNFEDSHTSGAAGAGDRVIGNANDGAATGDGAFDGLPDCDHLNNASALILPDGTPPLIEMFLWSASPCGPRGTYDVNGADDAFIVFHEYAHGLSLRLVTDSLGFGALGDGRTLLQSGAIGEGTSDWYALDLLNAEGLEPDSGQPGELRAGRHENLAVRSQPFDCPVGAPASACPGTAESGAGGYTYADYGKIESSPDVHAAGEIWVETLWDLRTSLISAHGRSEGITRARALVTDGLRLSPAFPTFLQMRNAILQADVNRAFGDRDRIWAVFAVRGMGLNASTTGDDDLVPVADFTAPPPLPAPAALPPASTEDRTRPVVSSFSMTPRRFAVGRGRTPRSARVQQGSAFRFRLSERATVRIVLERILRGRRVGRRCRPPSRRLRRHRPCTRYRSVGTLTRRDLEAGRRRVAFSGRLGARALRPGDHRGVISAADAAGNRSRARKLTFEIVRRRPAS